MNNKIEKYKEIIANVKKLRKPKEKNIFSIGGKGHYENPISDILAFYFDINEDHNLHNLCIKSYFECLYEQNYLDTLPALNQFVKPPEREIKTDNNKKIDMLIEGNNWVLVIENKMRHKKVNPFSDYEEYVKKYYGGKTIYLTILSPNDDNTPDSWASITYENFINSLTNNLGKYVLDFTTNKWLIMLREFILNIREELEIFAMDEKLANFIEDNIEEIEELQNIKNDYSKYIIANTNIDDGIIQSFMLMIALKEPPMIALIEPLKNGHFRASDGVNF